MTEWIKWDAATAKGYVNECPVEENTNVLVQLGDASVSEHIAGDICWGEYYFKGSQIVAYRVISKDNEVISHSKRSTDTNPKRQYGIKSIPMNLWPPIASAYGAIGLYNGSLKYGQSNYKATPVEASIYIAAAMRHLLAWADGEEFDPKDKVPNLAGVLANVAIILEARANGTLIDDRQISSGYLQEREALEKIVVSLQELHKDKNPKHNWAKDA